MRSKNSTQTASVHRSCCRAGSVHLTIPCKQLRQPGLAILQACCLLLALCWMLKGGEAAAEDARNSSELLPLAHRQYNKAMDLRSVWIALAGAQHPCALEN